MRAARVVIVAALLSLGLALAATVFAAPPAGPPYPSPQPGQYVYDYAGIFSATTKQTVQDMIVAINQRTAAGIVVYTQVKPDATTAETVQDANDLIDAWGVGRKGFDDGLAILFNMDESLCHGQVQLYAGPGYAAAFLSNSERQSIYQDDMLPLLEQCDMDGALLAAMNKIDAAATPEHAATLQNARILDALVGFGGILLALVLVAWALWWWLRYGRDPVYLDDPSILMPAPPPDLTPASAAVIWEGHTTRRALTTAMLDLASRGAITFRQEKHLMSTRAGIQVNSGSPTDPNAVRNQRRPTGAAEDYALSELRVIAGGATDDYIPPDDLLKFGTHVDSFNKKLEQHLVDKNWFREAPGKSTRRWLGRAIIVGSLGVLAFFGADSIPSQGVTVLGAALVVAGIVIGLLSRVMPARTMSGAMIYAMLAAYRRTMEMTMAQARSMQQVVEQPTLAWLGTPDQGVVWGTALGLQHQVEDVIGRSAEDQQAGVTTYHPWVPLWYTSSAGGTSSGAGGFAPGLFSSSAVPNFSGMFAALGAIGNSPGSSGGGGFGGGGGGGGGGGAGGGF
jgi:uncharacterized membrane protein YgcG